MTMVFGIIGDPIAQVRSPSVFNALFKERGVDAVMVPMHVEPDHFQQSLDGMRWIKNLAGIVVTVPHKFAAAEACVGKSRRVLISGAANALKPIDGGWGGDLFDGEGFATGLEVNGTSLEGKTCFIAGAGGAGTAIAMALLDRSVASLDIWDVDQNRAAALISRLKDVSDIPMRVGQIDETIDVAINASPIGMDEADPLPFEISALKAEAIVCEAIMKPPKTRLLVDAERRGLSIQEGRHMLDNQVEAIWNFFGL